VPFVPSAETFTYCNFYFKKPESSNVTCTFQITTPNGTVLNGTITKPCTAIAPVFKMKEETGTVGINPQTAMFEYAGVPGTLGGVSYIWGIKFKGYVQTPVLFTDIINYASGYGHWGYIQTVKGTRNRLYQGTVEHSNLNSTAFELDGTFPMGGITWLGNTNVNNQTEIGDAPAEGLWGGNTNDYLSINESLQNWMIYLPPMASNQSVCYVPLHEIDWAWGGTVTCLQSPDGWTLSNPIKTVDDKGDYPNHPAWLSRSNVANAQWINGPWTP
jgi:hypothetical protein